MGDETIFEHLVRIERINRAALDRHQQRAGGSGVDRTTDAMLAKAEPLLEALRETTQSADQHASCELVLSWIKDRREHGS